MKPTAAAMTQASKAATAPRLLYLVSEDWYFLSHRLPMARAARDAGFDVHVATRVDKGGAAIEAEGFTLHPLNWRRGSTNPLDFAKSRRASAPRLSRGRAGSGASGRVLAVGRRRDCRFRARHAAAVGARRHGLCLHLEVRRRRACCASLLRPFLRHLLSGPHAAVLVQNPDDYQAMAALGIAPERIALIPGSGVDTERLTPLPEPAGPITMAYVGRLLDDKGLRTLIAAHALLNARGENVRLLIAGEADPANPASIPDSEIAAWRQQPGVELLGHVADIASVWAKAHIAVLPSRREGLPLSLLEAAACGRAIVATDVPGCREIARAGLNALLVPVDDAQALADAVQRLAQDAALRAKFAAAGRALVEREFAEPPGGRRDREIISRHAIVARLNRFRRFQSVTHCNGRQSRRMGDPSRDGGGGRSHQRGAHCRAASLARALRAGAAQCALLAQAADPARRRHRGGRGDDDRHRRARWSCFRALFGDPRALAGTLAAVLGLAIVGVTDDVRPLEALPRLILQAAAVAVVLAHAAGRPAHRAGAAVVAGARRPADRRHLVREPRQLHGRHRLDDGGGSRAAHRRACRVRADGRAAAGCDGRCVCACAAPCSASRRSTGRWRGCFSATSAACRSG